MNKSCLFLFLLSFPLVLTAQTTPRFPVKSNRISIGLMGAPNPPIGIAYSQMVGEKFSVEVGMGTWASGIRANYFFTNPTKHRLNFYSGLSAMMNYDGFPMFYLPVGLSLSGKKNFDYRFEAGVLTSENVDPNPSPWLGLSVGYLFGEDISTVPEREKTGKKNIISLFSGYNFILGGLLYERLLTPSLSVEAGLGYLGAAAGAKLYFPSLSEGHLGFHAGVSQTWGFFGWGTYFLFGINLLTQKDLWFSLDVGPQIYYDPSNDYLPVYYSIKVGKAF